MTADNTYKNIYEHVCQAGQIFVFGSNALGRHGMGAARTAAESYGAIYGQGSGRMGMSYAIMTKDINMRPMSLEQIKASVNAFITYAKANEDLVFFLTPIGTGLAGYKRSEIRPLFNECDWGGKSQIVYAGKDAYGHDTYQIVGNKFDVQLASRIRWARSWLYGQ